MHPPFNISQLQSLALMDTLNGISGFDKATFTEAHRQEPPVSIRLHPIKSGSIEMNTSGNVPWCTWGRYLRERPSFTLDPLLHAGAYYVQEASSMFLHSMVQHLFPNATQLKVLDLCAAPGGKSTLLAAALDTSCLILSNEVIRSRCSILEENIVKWGYPNQWITSNDPKDFGAIEGYFDLIVVDAPCSGSGLFRKEPLALHHWTDNNVSLCSGRQKRILADIWNSLKENGVLIYATCSYSPQENEEVLDWLATEFSATTIPIPTDAYPGIVASESDNHSMMGYRFFPDKIKGEGFFIAAVRKTQATNSVKYPKTKTVAENKGALLLKDKLQPDAWSCMENAEGIAALSSAHRKDYELLKQQLYFRKVGVSIGTITSKEWIPHHETALSIARSHDIPQVEVNKETALRFLKKEALESLQLTKGWYLVCYKGLALGWIKALGNRINNYLPKNQRIRMELPSEFNNEE